VARCRLCGANTGWLGPSVCSTCNVEHAVVHPYVEDRTARRKRAWLVLGMGTWKPPEQFECCQCGRWEDVLDAGPVAERMVTMGLGLTVDQWVALREAARGGPVRPSVPQRLFACSFDQSVALLENATYLGLLEAQRNGLFVSRPRCHVCYERPATRSPSKARASSRDPIPAQLRFQVLQRDAFRCRYCGRSQQDGARLHVDHVIPVAAGGDTVEGNLMTACEQCNLGKAAKPVLP
jgi:5-methylcytosine-specific restriction endonuclease McrA